MEGIKIVRKNGVVVSGPGSKNTTASIFIGLFACSFLLLGGYAYYLKTKLDRAKVNLVSEVLVELVDLLQGVHLLNEVFYGVDWLLQRSGGVFNPSTSKVGAFLLHSRDELLNPVNVSLGGGGQHLLDDAGVDLEESNVGLLGEVISEVVTVVDK